MANYEVKKVGVGSVLKTLPMVFAILGAIIGIFTFFLFPTDVARDLTFGAKGLSWLIFIILYTIIMVVGLVVVAWLYNFVAAKMGGVKISLQQGEMDDN